MPMTAYESEKFVGRSRVTINKYVKAGLIGTSRAKKRIGSQTVVLYNAADLSIIFGKPLPPEFADELPEKAINYSPAPRKKSTGRPKGSRNKRWSDVEITHTLGRCEEIYRAGGDLLKAYYASKQTTHRARAVYSVLIDRVIGMLGLILLGGIMASYQYISTDHSASEATCWA